MSYTAHHDLLTIPVYSPLHRREWLISPMQYRLMCHVLKGKRVTQRELADHLGCSIAGVNGAIKSLVSGGILAAHTFRGRLGFTFLKVKAGAIAVRNVRYLGTKSLGRYQETVDTSSTRSNSVGSWIANIYRPLVESASMGMLQ